MCATWILMLSLLNFVVNNEALWCTPCTTEILDKCGDNDVKTCKFGVVKDVCKCCDVCAKGPNESCGGPFYMDGRCGEGLNCHPELNPENWYFPGNCTAEQLQPGADEVIKQWETFK